MQSHRFDRLTNALGIHLSRRSALRTGAGLGGLAVAGVTKTAAQEATPAAPAVAPGLAEEVLFVQSFVSGAWAPKPDEAGVYRLTLSGHPAETMYLSDRPQRIAGTVPTAQFLDALGFTPENPPNAAVVARTDAGEDMLVVELFNPTLSQAFGTAGGVEVSYEARVLADYGGDGLASLADRQGDEDLPSQFGPVSLFIDNCLDTTVRCMLSEFDQVNDFSPVGTCWNGNTNCCTPCSGGATYWAGQCNDAYAGCNGNCFAVDSNPFECALS